MSKYVVKSCAVMFQGKPYPPGTIIELPDEKAEYLLKGGIITSYEEPVEIADEPVAPADETLPEPTETVEPKGKRKKK